MSTAGAFVTSGNVEGVASRRLARCARGVATVRATRGTMGTTARCGTGTSRAIERAARRGRAMATSGRGEEVFARASSASMSLDEDEDGETVEIRSSPASGRARRGGASSTSSDSRAEEEPLTYENAALERKGERRVGVLSSRGSTMQLLGSEEATTSGEGKPLKINQDLTLYRARKLRNEAGFMKSKDDRFSKRYEAIAMFEKAMAYDVTDGRAYCGIGKILSQMGRLDEAREVYQAGVDAKGGDNAYLWVALAVLEEKAGNKVLARKYHDAATAADKTHAAAWHGWGTLEKNMGNYQRCLLYTSDAADE